MLLRLTVISHERAIFAVAETEANALGTGKSRAFGAGED